MKPWRNKKYRDETKRVWACGICDRYHPEKQEFHHIKDAEFSGTGQKCHDFLGFTVCKDCHDNCQSHKVSKSEQFQAVFRTLVDAIEAERLIVDQEMFVRVIYRAVQEGIIEIKVK